MCGFAGVILNNRNSTSISDIVEGMGETLNHRGPDARGHWIDNKIGVGFAHRRLSIVDRSESGEQPAKSRNGQFVLAYNGEIYNHQAIRKELQGDFGPIDWRGHSDTETLVEAIALWGLVRTLREVVGMFAFALWDNTTQELVLCRDRFGEKPLFYSFQGSDLAFGSELKALVQVPNVNLEIDPEAVASFVHFGYVRDPKTIYKSVWKVPPGSFVRFRKKDLAANHIPQPQEYWSFGDIALKGLNLHQRVGSLDDASLHLHDLLAAAIQGQIMGDVPLGAFLSGGIDSSTVVALMQAQSSMPVKTFSIGFEDAAYDESRFAQMISSHLGTSHRSLTVTAEDAQGLIPLLPALYDEPFADSSQIPTFFLSKLAKEDVTVALSGDGGDEVFGGYNRYWSAAANWAKIERIPLWLRKSLAGLANRVPTKALEGVAGSILGRIAPRFALSPSETLHKIGRAIGSASGLEMYIRLCETGDSRSLSSKAVTSNSLRGGLTWPIDADLVHQSMAFDTISYLPGDILTKVDRASMSQSLETRMPFLDHRIVEFAWSLPLGMKVGPAESKIVLRRVLERYVPRAMFERPKMGFGVPLAQWLRGPLRGWAEDLLSRDNLATTDYFDVAAVQAQWESHKLSKSNHQYSLWNVLMFQGWLSSSSNNANSCEQLH